MYKNLLGKSSIKHLFYNSNSKIQLNFTIIKDIDHTKQAINKR